MTSLSFQGQCREAFEFYAAVLGGKITSAMSYGDAPMDMPISDPKYKDWLMHCWLEVGDQAIMGAPNIEKPKNGFDVTLHTADIDEARRWYEQLSEGGKQTMPLAATFWTLGFGALIDKFGIAWMINVTTATD